MTITITRESIWIAAVLTIIFIFFHQAYLRFLRFSPFRHDDRANEALFFIHMICKDYFYEFQMFPVEGREEFTKKLNQMVEVFNLDRMQDEWYRNQLRYLLHKYHGPLKESFILFNALRHRSKLEYQDLQAVIDYTHHTINEIIHDLENRNKQSYVA